MTTSANVSGTNSVLLPTSEVDVSMPAVTGRTINVGAGGDLQAAINAAQPGDKIVLAAGAVFTGSYTLPNKTGNGWITITSAGPLPAEGTRATAADAAGMATIMAPGSNAPAIQTAPGAHNFRLVGLNITAAPSVTEMTSLVNLGDGSSAQNTMAAQPHDIIIDRSYIHGSSSLDLRRGVALNSASSGVINSTISEVHSAGCDAQAIAGWNGTGPYLIQNNSLQASGENVMFGGADPSIPNALPSDITIRGNDFYKPTDWKGQWLAKNLLELKIGQRVLIENNHFENSWPDGQAGYAINMKSTDQDGTAPWSNTSNVTVRNNTFENTTGGISISAAPDPNTAVPSSNFSITGNTFQNVGGTDGNPAGSLFMLTGYNGSLKNVTIANNTAVSGDNNLASTISFDGDPTQGLTFTGNTLTQGAYGIKGSGASEGLGTLSAYAPDAVFSGNTLIGGDADDYGSYASQNSFPSTAPVSPPSPVSSPAPSSNPLAISIAGAGGTVTTARQRIAGTATAGATVNLFDDGDALGTAVKAKSDGTWSTMVTLTGTGAHDIAATATGSNGQTTSSSPVSLYLDTAPVFTSQSGRTRYVVSNTATTIGTLQAVDADQGDSVTYALLDGTGKLANTVDGVTVNASTGTLSFAGQPANGVLRLNAVATDSHGVSASQKLTVCVTPSNSLSGDLTGLTSDTFVFHDDFGTANVRRFQVADTRNNSNALVPHDVLALSHTLFDKLGPGASEHAIGSMLASHTTQVGADTVLTTDSRSTLTLTNVNRAALIKQASDVAIF